jgi:nucleoside-diphosphate-sugar epimerase
VAKIQVTGAAGYVSCVLVPKLLAAGHSVVVFDIMYFGSQGLPSDPSLDEVEGDLRDTPAFAATVAGCDAVIHLA